MPVARNTTLSRDERMLIYKMSGEGYSLRDIHKSINSYSQTRFTLTTIQKALDDPHSNKYIAKFRDEFLKEIKHIPITDKSTRLKELESLRQRISMIVNGCHFDRGEAQINKFFRAQRALLDILDMARNEMEPRNGIGIGININNGEMSELTDEELKNQRDQLLKKAGKSFKRRSSFVDEGSEGDGQEDSGESSGVLLAAPEELLGDGLPPSAADVPDARQPEGDDSGMPSV